jgi:hypothetical protein
MFFMSAYLSFVHVVARELAARIGVAQFVHQRAIFLRSPASAPRAL